MLIPFTKKDGGELFIRAEDLRAIDDVAHKGAEEQSFCRLYFIRGNDLDFEVIPGTAREVFNALAQEERRRAEEYAKVSNGLPVARGRPR